MKMSAIFLITLILGLSIAEAASAETVPKVSLSAVKAALSDIQIFKGPDSSKLTRSPWGPDLYRAKVGAVVVVMPFEVPTSGEPRLVGGKGSGVVVSQDGVIVTNWHVTWPHEYAVVIFYPGPTRTYEELVYDDIRYAQVLKVAQMKDLALLQLITDPSGTRTLPSVLDVVSLENPAQVKIGQDVFTIGHPEDLHWTYTEGVISQIRPRYRWTSDRDSFRATVIQTQTTVSYGSSGGPLINQNGRLVGIISQAMGTRPGFNFAISVHELKTFLGK